MSGPIINGIVEEGAGWGTNNCKEKSDIYKYKKDNNKPEDEVKQANKDRNLCNRQKAMYGLEYSSYIIDVSLGFICAILGLLHFFDVGKSFQKYSGLIGLVTGIVGFVLTLVYIIYSGYIFTKDYTNGYDTSLSSNNYYMVKLNGEGAFAEKDGENYKCIYYKEKDQNAVFTKYKDLGKKQYNYEKKRNYDKKDEYLNCLVPRSSARNCGSNQYYTDPDHFNDLKVNGCKNVYLEEVASGFKNKYLYDNWVTNIIFGCFIIACEIGLAIFGFLVFKNSDGSGI